VRFHSVSFPNSDEGQYPQRPKTKAGPEGPALFFLERTVNFNETEAAFISSSGRWSRVTRIAQWAIKKAGSSPAPSFLGLVGILLPFDIRCLYFFNR
jgi:hypothetical protein